ncbi:MAG: hypothetical protein JW827_04850 [Spirochaetes bacterium]|nr:hypothetical protein [Spirochaetota bacterium]
MKIKIFGMLYFRKTFFKNIMWIFLLFLLVNTSYSSVTIRTGHLNLEYTGLFSKKNYYSEKDEPLKNASMIRGSIKNFQLEGEIYTNAVLFDSLFDIEFNNDLIDFKCNRVSLYAFDNRFLFGSLPLQISSAVNNTNNMVGIMWQAPLLPENQLNSSLFGARIKEGFDSPYYPTYLYGLELLSTIRKVKMSAFYCRVEEQEEGIKNNSILQQNFNPSYNTLNKITARNSKGSIRKSISIDMDTDPFLEISVVDTGDRNTGWELEADDGNVRVTLQYITKQAGVFRYNLKAPTGWSGLKSITLYLHIYNSPYDLSDNSLYVDYIKIYNTSETLYNYEDFSDWIIPDDVTWDVLTKEETILSLPEAYFPFQSHYFGFSIGKDKGDMKGLIDMGFNETDVSPAQTQNGYFLKSRLSYSKRNISTGLGYNRVSKDFNIGPLHTIAEPKKDLKDDPYFFTSPTSFFGNWTQEYVEIVSMVDSIKLTGEGGQIYKYFNVDLDKYPVLSIKVGGDAGEDFEWALYVEEDDNTSFLLDYSSKTGIFNYNIKEITGWSGKKKFKVRIKKGKGDLYLYWVKFWRCGVSREYGFGQDSQIVDFDISFNLAKKLKTVSALKLWDNTFSSYHYSIKCYYDIINKQKNIVQFNTGIRKNRGDELKDIEEIPRLFEYVGVDMGVLLKYNFNRLVIPGSFMQYDINWDERSSVKLFTYNFGVKYLLAVWLGYNIKGRSGKIVDTSLEDYTQEYSIEKNIPIFFDTIFIFKYILTSYLNLYEKEYNYNTNLFEAGLKRQIGYFQSLLSFQYKIGEFGQSPTYKYNSYTMKLQMSLGL